MSKFRLSSVKFITRSEKAHFESLGASELRELLNEFRSKRDYMRASYISRLLVRRVNA